MIRYKHTFEGIDYDFDIPAKIFIVWTKSAWNFINGQYLDLVIKKDNDGEYVISFLYKDGIHYNTTWFYPHEILNPNIVKYIPAERFEKLKAFL